MHESIDVSYALYFAEMQEEHDDLFRIGEMKPFDGGGEREAQTAGLFASPDEAVAIWNCRMDEQGYSVEEMPWCRLRGLGLVYGVTPPCGGESCLYSMMVVDGEAVW